MVLHHLPDDINHVQPGGRENQELSSRPSLDDRCQCGSQVVICLRQREQCLRDVDLCVVPLYPCKLLGTH